MSASERIEPCQPLHQPQARTAKRLVVDHHEHVSEEAVHRRPERRGFGQCAAVIGAPGQQGLDYGTPRVELAGQRDLRGLVQQLPQLRLLAFEAIELLVGQLARDVLHPLERGRELGDSPSR